MSSMDCVLCAITRPQNRHSLPLYRHANGQWWSLRNYYGISGEFCPGCFDKISHDSYGRPNHRAAFRESVEELVRKGLYTPRD
jgi:hypothetical protein